MIKCFSLDVQILILADESVEDSAIQADSRSLATLLLIRDIQVLCDQRPGGNFCNFLRSLTLLYLFLHNPSFQE